MSNDTSYQRSLVWFRRDLRLEDHAALYHALKQSQQVFCVFVFDTDILHGLPSDDRRLPFIHESLYELDLALQQHGGNLLVLHGKATQLIPMLANQLTVDAVFMNQDYEPLANQRDQQVQTSLENANMAFHRFKDQVIFEKNEILSAAQQAFSVFTPYKNAWLKKILGNGGAFFYRAYPTEKYLHRLAKAPGQALPTLASLGFANAQPQENKLKGGVAAAQALLADFLPRMTQYEQARDYPALKGPSYLSVHLRFGTLSIRQLVRMALQRDQQTVGGSQGAQTWLNELIWRDFYFMILHHHPRVALPNERGQTASFKPAYDAIQWESGADAEVLFDAWCNGRTGYPLVDAAMLQLNQTGYMHNRLRMVVASFLIKDLGIDWRRGEAYFAAKLNDFDLAANNGGWQWAASSGCDAQPYFRIFNPITQSEKFDPEGKFIKRYLPKLQSLNTKQIHAPWQCSVIELQLAGITLGVDYPLPVIEHRSARARTLLRYAVVRQPADNGNDHE